MKKIVAMCGLICTECPAFAATFDKDENERERIADAWPAKHIFNPVDPPCDGCLANEGNLIEFCRECEVRFCGFNKNVRNCAHCDEYPCEKLTRLWKNIKAPKAKLTLDDIRKNL